MINTNEEAYRQLRIALRQLFDDAGYEHAALFEWLDEAERQTARLEEMDALAAENLRLKQEVKRLRDLYYNKTVNVMSTKLKDALRE